MILPERNDIVDLIKNAPPENSLDEFINTFRGPDNQRELPPRRLDRGPRPTEPSSMDSWGVERNSDQTFRNLNSRNSFGTQTGIDRFDFTTPPSGIDRSFGHSRGNSFQRDSVAPNRHLDFSGISNPSILQALNNHFNRNPMHVGGRHPFHRHNSFHDTFHSFNEAPPPSATSIPPRKPLGHIDNGQARRGDRIVSDHGTHTTLLGSLNPILSEINRRQGDIATNDNFHHNSQQFSSRTLRGKHLTGNTRTTDTDVFGNPTTKLFPSASKSRLTSPSSKWQSDTSDSLHSEHPEQHIHHAHRPTQLRLQGPFNSEFRSHPKTTSLHSRHRLPRKIIVHSMDIAQHLLHRYPQLKGRVFLSSRAHRLNKYANVVSRYRFRRRW